MKKLQKIGNSSFSIFEKDVVKELQNCFGGTQVSSTLTGGTHYNLGYRHDTCDSTSTKQPDGTTITDLSNFVYTA
jgi:hypothetical protein